MQHFHSHACKSNTRGLPSTITPAPSPIDQPELRTSRKSHNFPIKRKWAIYLPWNQWESPIKISSFCCTVALASGHLWVWRAEWGGSPRWELRGQSGQDPGRRKCGRKVEAGAVPRNCSCLFRFGCRKCNAKCLPPLQLFIVPTVREVEMWHFQGKVCEKKSEASKRRGYWLIVCGDQ